MVQETKENGRGKETSCPASVMGLKEKSSPTLQVQVCLSPSGRVATGPVEPGRRARRARIPPLSRLFRLWLVEVGHPDSALSFLVGVPLMEGGRNHESWREAL